MITVLLGVATKNKWSNICLSASSWLQQFTCSVQNTLLFCDLKLYDVSLLLAYATFLLKKGVTESSF